MIQTVERPKRSSRRLNLVVNALVEEVVANASKRLFKRNKNIRNKYLTKNRRRPEDRIFFRVSWDCDRPEGSELIRSDGHLFDYFGLYEGCGLRIYHQLYNGGQYISKFLG